MDKFIVASVKRACLIAKAACMLCGSQAAIGPELCAAMTCVRSVELRAAVVSVGGGGSGTGGETVEVQGTGGGSEGGGGSGGGGGGGGGGMACVALGGSTGCAGFVVFVSTG